MTVFQGSYADLKFIKTRSVASITIEIPIERANEFVAAFGAPMPGIECPVAIARLDLEKTVTAQIEAPKERRRFADLPMSQQSALRCDDVQFRTFLRAHNFVVATSDEAAEAVRNLIGVASRADILPETPAGRGWIELERKFAEWRLA